MALAKLSNMKNVTDAEDKSSSFILEVEGDASQTEEEKPQSQSDVIEIDSSGIPSDMGKSVDRKSGAFSVAKKRGRPRKTKVTFAMKSENKNRMPDYTSPKIYTHDVENISETLKHKNTKISQPTTSSSQRVRCPRGASKQASSAKTFSGGSLNGNHAEKTYLSKTGRNDKNSGTETASSPITNITNPSQGESEKYDRTGLFQIQPGYGFFFMPTSIGNSEKFVSFTEIIQNEVYCILKRHNLIEDENCTHGNNENKSIGSETNLSGNVETQRGRGRPRKIANNNSLPPKNINMDVKNNRLKGQKFKASNIPKVPQKQKRDSTECQGEPKRKRQKPETSKGSSEDTSMGLESSSSTSERMGQETTLDIKQKIIIDSKNPEQISFMRKLGLVPNRQQII